MKENQNCYYLIVFFSGYLLSLVTITQTDENNLRKTKYKGNNTLLQVQLYLSKIVTNSQYYTVPIRFYFMDIIFLLCYF